MTETTAMAVQEKPKYLERLHEVRYENGYSNYTTLSYMCPDVQLEEQNSVIYNPSLHDGYSLGVQTRLRNKSSSIFLTKGPGQQTEEG